MTSKSVEILHKKTTLKYMKILTQNEFLFRPAKLESLIIQFRILSFIISIQIIIMSQWKLPVIQSKKQFNDDDDYNFVNKEKKKSKEQTGALSMIEELKAKIQEQKKQIQNRNSTIMGLQRNFQSLSGIVKHEKAQSAALKAEIQALRQNSQVGDKRALEFHEKCIILQNQNKMLKQELSNLRKAHSECNRMASQSDAYRNKIMQLQGTIQKYSAKLDNLNQQKNIIAAELVKMRGEQKAKRVLQERIVDLEEQIKKSMDSNNILHDKIKIYEDKLYEIKTTTNNNESKLNELNRKLKQQQNKRKLAQQEKQEAKKDLRQKTQHIQNLKKNADSLDLYSKMRQQQEEKIKEQLKQAKQKSETYKSEIAKLNEQMGQIQKQKKKNMELLGKSQKEIEEIKKMVGDMQKSDKEKEKKYMSEIQKLTKWASKLNQELNDTNSKNNQLISKLSKEQQQNETFSKKMKKLQGQLGQINSTMQNQNKYSKYFKQIDQNQRRGVYITNKKEIQKLNEQNFDMRKYITSLETEVNLKSKQLSEKNKTIRNMQEVLQRLKGEEEKLAKTIADQKKKSEQYIAKSQKQIQQEKQQANKKVEEQKRRAEQYKKMLDQYQAEEQKLKKLIEKQHDEIKMLAQTKEQELKQKELEIEKQRKNNKLLWTDNKKLKELQQKVREQAEMQVLDLQNRKKQQIQRLKRQIQRKYEQELYREKQQESNSNELRKILQEKAQQIKIITQNHTKAKTELQFYKNRNKELEGVVTRSEKVFKDQISSLERDLKAQKQVVSVLDKKNTEISLMKQESEKKSKGQIDKLNQQIQYLKQKYEGQKIEQKIALLKKSVSEFQSTLKAIGNSMSCNYCMQPVKQCVRLKQCGHIYCKKCKAGYQPNCGQCKKSGIQMADKIVDDTISKTEYMKIIINTIKQDFRQISL